MGFRGLGSLGFRGITIKYILLLHAKRVHVHYHHGVRPQNHNRDGRLGPNSRMVVCMDPVGYITITYISIYLRA